MDTGYKFKVIHDMVTADDNRLSISMLCSIAGVSRSGYYQWVKAEGTRKNRELKDQADFELILIAYNHRGYKKGARSIYMTMLHWNPPVVMNDDSCNIRTRFLNYPDMQSSIIRTSVLETYGQPFL
ncbi:MAG: hypothetical protein E7309_16200 [Butyrivibrio sp.]|jgi:hypothetical protein|nr:hypothetical protein [Butyrivibrio sp.]